MAVVFSELVQIITSFMCSLFLRIWHINPLQERICGANPIREIAMPNIAEAGEINIADDIERNGNGLAGVATTMPTINPSGYISNALVPQPPGPSSSISVHQAPQPAAGDLDNELKIAAGLFTASAGSIVPAVVTGFKGNITHLLAFHAFSPLVLIAMISDSIVLLLGVKRPKISYLVKLVRLTLCFSFASLILAYIWAVSIVLIDNHLGTIVAAVVLSVFVAAGIIVSLVF